MLCEELMERLRPITEEEQQILQGSDIDRKRYTTGREFTMDRHRLLEKGKLMDIRTHTRFVHFPRHRHNYIEAIYMCSGSTTHILGAATPGQKVVLEEGDLLFLNQHSCHEILPAGENDVAVNFLMLPEFFDEAFSMIEQDNVIGRFLVSTLCQDENEGEYLHFKLAGVTPVQNLIENMIWSQLFHQDNRRKINQYTMGVLLLQLLEFSDRLEGDTPDQYENKLVLTALRYIESHYREGTLAELSALMNQPDYTVSRLLKGAAGMTFKELLQQKRLQKAMELLSQTRLSVSDIIAAVGYDNTSYFYRIFKKETGMSPKEYRAGLPAPCK